MYFVNRKQKYNFALFVASLYTVGDIAHKKIGGLLAGAVYSDSHTWPEIAGMAPRFISEFGVIFFAVLAYYLLAKEEVELICPKCQHSFIATNLEGVICSKCGSKPEKLKGFYKRHPELEKDKKALAERSNNLK